MRRVNIGFQGGGVLATRLSDEALDGLRSALQGQGWHQLDTDDGRVDVKLDDVVYLSENSHEPRVGFGGAR
jgi:hypothetical protein